MTTVNEFAKSVFLGVRSYLQNQGGPCLGELSLIDAMQNISSNSRYLCARIYLSTAADSLQMATLAGCFEACGAEDVQISMVMHDMCSGNNVAEGRAHDGVRVLDVAFFPPASVKGTTQC